MQSVKSLSFEAIPSRFCESGTVDVDYATISSNPSDSFSFFNGLSAAFTNPGNYIKRQHVNAIGRIGTTAQAIVQCGGLVGYMLWGVAYPKNAVVTLFDGCFLSVWISLVEANGVRPPGADNHTYYTVTNSSEVADGLPTSATNWALASVGYGNPFFDVS